MADDRQVKIVVEDKQTKMKQYVDEETARAQAEHDARLDEVFAAGAALDAKIALRKEQNDA